MNGTAILLASIKKKYSLLCWL